MFYSYPPLIQATFSKRIDQHHIECLIDDQLIIASCINTAELGGLLNKGAPIWVSMHNDQATWEITFQHDTMIGVNPAHTVPLMQQILRQEKEFSFFEYKRIQQGTDTADFELRDNRFDDDCFIMTDTCLHTNEDNYLLMPQSTPQRIQNLLKLTELAKNDKRAVHMLIAPRFDSEALVFKSDVDLAYRDAVLAAFDAGVEFMCYTMLMTDTGVLDCQRILNIGPEIDHYNGLLKDFRKLETRLGADPTLGGIEALYNFLINRVYPSEGRMDLCDSLENMTQVAKKRTQLCMAAEMLFTTSAARFMNISKRQAEQFEEPLALMLEMRKFHSGK